MAGRILVVDDIATNRMVMAAQLKARYFDVLVAENGAEGLELAQNQDPDIVLLDCVMPGLDGFEVCKRLKADARTRDIPVVMVTALETHESRLQALGAGADDFLPRPITDTALFARIRQLLRERQATAKTRAQEASIGALGIDVRDGVGDATAPHTVTILGTHPRIGRLARALRKDGGLNVTTMDPAQPLNGAEPLPSTDALVLDVPAETDDDAALELLGALRRRFGDQDPVIMLAAGRDRVALAARALDFGAQDHVLRPFDPAELVLRLGTQLDRRAHRRQVSDSVNKGLELAVRDPLTGLCNRRYAESGLARLAGEAGPGDKTLSILLLDIDRFKSINDTYGHASGDAVLRNFSALVQRNLREDDLLARVGGEEFMIAMPNTPLARAQKVAERLRARISAHRFDLENGRQAEITVSIGLAQGTGTQAAKALLDRADKAMLQGKVGGRNQVRTACAAVA